MTIAHLFEDYSASREPHSISISDISLEEQRLEAFEKGYKAGWEDSVEAAREDSRHISTDLSGNLQDISFTLQEAQTGLLAALRPLLCGLVDSILPRLARASVGARVLETLEAMAGKAVDGSLEIVTAPENRTALQTLLDERGMAEVRLTTEPSLGEGQVHVRAGSCEQEIDLDAVLAQIDAAMTGFLNENQKESA